MQTGIASVTFRNLDYREVISLTRQAKLDGIEWGGDIHCPPDNGDAAREIAASMAANNLTTISYGSYYKAGSHGRFEPVVAAAMLLGTTNIRIWAGDKASLETDENLRGQIVEDSRRIADMSAVHGISVSFEYHNGTLTDNIESAMLLMSEVDRENVYLYWQPPAGSSIIENIESIRRIAGIKKLKNMHVYSNNGVESMPLSFGEAGWRQYIKEAAPSDPALLLEFVKDNDVGRFIEDAKFLKSLI